MEGVGQLLPLVLIIAVFWFLLIRPQRKRQMELARTQRGVNVGDEVLLGSGLYGTVVDTEEDVLRLEISPGTAVRVARGAVVRVVTPGPASRAPEHSDDDLGGHRPGDGPGDSGSE